MELLYRKAKMSDLAGINAFVQAAIQNMIANNVLQWDEIYPTQQDFQQDIEQGQLYVGEAQGESVVVFVINEHSDPEYQDGRWNQPDLPFCVVHRLCVNPRFQHQGVAEQTVRQIELRAVAMGYRAIRLDTFHQNLRAVALYQRMKFQHVGDVQLRKGRFHLMEKYLAVQDVSPENCT